MYNMFERLYALTLSVTNNMFSHFFPFVNNTESHDLVINNSRESLFVNEYLRKFKAEIEKLPNSVCHSFQVLIMVRIF